MSVSSWAQNPIDIKGWNTTSWGMTEDDIINMFPEKIVKIDQGKKQHSNSETFTPLKIQKYTVGDADLEIFFEMGVKDKKLQQVRMICRNPLPSQFTDFEKLLIGKYGQPTHSAEPRSPFGYEKTSSWMFPSTKIDLIYKFTRGMGSIINILYTNQEITKVESDKL